MKRVGAFVKNTASLFNRMYFSLSVNLIPNCEVSGRV